MLYHITSLLLSAAVETQRETLCTKWTVITIVIVQAWDLYSYL